MSCSRNEDRLVSFCTLQNWWYAMISTESLILNLESIDYRVECSKLPEPHTHWDPHALTKTWWKHTTLLSYGYSSGMTRYDDNDDLNLITSSTFRHTYISKVSIQAHAGAYLKCSYSHAHTHAEQFLTVIQHSHEATVMTLTHNYGIACLPQCQLCRIVYFYLC